MDNKVPQYLAPYIDIKLSDPRCTPMRANPSDAGADLVCMETVTIYPEEMMMVDTGVAIRIPRGFVGIVAPRSSQGKIRVSLANTLGIIDADYRGNIKLLLVNEGEDPYKIEGYKTRVAQLLIVPVMLPMFREFDGADWNDTARGFGGFGSTGV